jgi:hypothetical protein
VIARCVILVVALFAVDARAADSLAQAQALFYDGQYSEASAIAQTLTADEEMLPVYEFRIWLAGF